MTEKKRRRFDASYVAAAVERVRSTGKTPYAVATELGISPESVRRWVEKADAKPKRPAPRQSTVDIVHVDALVRENAELRRRIETLKGVVAALAREVCEVEP